ncbi:MAG: tRNA (adenosine(37)-N6)-threonylcarbamoyltransferase complex ATPase subunit type 1 TsaE [Spirochaetaceae bacterium]|jgi:tRNA threonylcarbamoyladenosine biosynthesis protein TsaE|nr:tRNA (adenosine(37)-N6)-threonylcarbamoyltransferase complex ATPase subunit type 1 TsaE [Spirochaetaceae bacterium]
MMRENSPKPEPAASARAVEIITRSPEETAKLGEKLAPFLKGGTVIALKGTLGAGKTCLAGGIARGLGVTETVTSPTYTIISEYEGLLPFYHIDAYRLSGDEEFDSLGAEDMLYGGGVTVIEWSERIPRSIPPDAWVIELRLLEDGGRMIRVEAANLVLDRGRLL